MSKPGLDAARRITTVALIVLLAGCNDVTEMVRDAYYHGTVVGYSRCIARNGDIGLSKGVVEAQCRARHEARIKGPFEATGQYYGGNYGIMVFGGEIQNKSTDTVLTRLEIQVEHKDNVDPAGRQISETIRASALHDDLWIEPGEEGYFIAQYPEFQPAKDRLMQGDAPLYSWRIAGTWGLKVALQ